MLPPALRSAARRLVLLAALSLSLCARAGAETRIRAIAFDAFPVFDPRPVAARAAELFPEKGAALVELWRDRQFEYQWLRALGGEHRDFLAVTGDALDFAAAQLGLALTDEDRARLLEPYARPRAWPDAAAALAALKAEGYRIVFLSNMTEALLRAGLEANGLEPYFDAVLSTDAARSFKPSPRAYALATERLGLRREEILFVAFAGWDAAGAKWFGYPTFWMNRAGAPAEALGAKPDGAGRDFAALREFLRRP